MADAEAACARSGQVIGTSERVRAREIAAYLAAASFPLDIAAGPPSKPVPSTDLTLNALVQHGVYKLDCDRAFLSFIDNHTQFICAEMTRGQSLQGQDPTQPLMLGTARIALEWGVCPHTMSIFLGRDVTLPATPYIVADESYFYIKDFRQVEMFASRPFVAGYPHMVSYIEVPLRSLSGHILGSYCVVDNKPRDFLHPDALHAIAEVAATINSYLNLKHTERGRIRSERMMDGLRQFIGSARHTLSEENRATESNATPFHLDAFEQTSWTSSNSHVNEQIEYGRSPAENHGDMSAISNMENNPYGLIDDSIDSETPTVSGPDPTPSLSDATTMTRKKNNDMKRSMPKTSTRISNLFFKSANTIGHAMDLDGLVFFDAVATGTRYESHSWSSFSTDNERLLPTTHRDYLPAEILSEYRAGTTAKQQMVHRPNQSLIRRLTATYPYGHVFTVDEHGILEPGAPEAEDQHPSNESAIYNGWKDLFECIPKARYAIFLPQWHYQRETCFSTCLAWVSDTGKTLDSNDINSLAAFGNSLMAEIFRLEAAMNTQQKSDFVSSISHELRSPLHGILATAELMQESINDPQLLSMIGMIDSCSYTLLDTFDHLLQFSGINSQGSDTPHGYSGGATTKNIAIDLGSLVEDILETVSLGYFSGSQMASDLKRERQESFAGKLQGTASMPTLVTTYIEHNHSWIVHVDIGAWKRILLGVFSNALRYTESGHVEVALRMSKQSEDAPRCINVCVTDTGIGMSQEFLKYHLFTPFMQESSLVSGTGLGLTIVKSIVESLDGDILVESRQYEGTRVTISIPFEEEVEKLDEPVVDSSVRCEKMQGLTIGVIGIASYDAPNGKSNLLVVPPSRVLQQSLRHICEEHLGMTLVDDQIIDVLLQQDIVLLDTRSLFAEDVPHLPEVFPQDARSALSRAVVILGPTTRELEYALGSKGAISINSPITRKTLRAAFTAALDQNLITTSNTLDPLPTAENQDVYSEPTMAKDLAVEHEPTISQSETTNLPLRITSCQPSQNAEENSSQNPILPQIAPSQQAHTSIKVTVPTVICRFERLLLVDDNPINLKVLAGFVKRTGRPFSTATDGAEAVRLYTKSVLEEAEPFDCVFLDISMPIMDGFQAAAAIRRFEEQQQHPQPKQDLHEQETVVDEKPHTASSSPALHAYIMALTGLGSEEARTMARDSGFDMFLLKPLKFKNLVPMLLPLPGD